jgi:hypothetical protein
MDPIHRRHLDPLRVDYLPQITARQTDLEQAACEATGG